MKILFVLLTVFLMATGCGDSSGSASSDDDTYAISFEGLPESDVLFNTTNNTSTLSDVRIIATQNGKPSGGITLRFSSVSVDDSENSNITQNQRGKVNMTILQGNEHINVTNSFEWTTSTASDGRPTGVNGQPYDLTFIELLGQRKITVKAEILAGSEPLVSETVIITFGKGPISALNGVPQADSIKTWDSANSVCASTGLPSYEQFAAIAGSIPNAFNMAGWQGGTYWHNNSEIDGGAVEIGNTLTDYNNYYIICKAL
ncbi:MAG: hypothetical protein LBH05_04355 [Deferribacteraceae bacterium]|nr:hypothetical protein [Deferribacteraceae bacterium]